MEQEYSYFLQIREIKRNLINIKILDDFIDQNIRNLENKLNEYSVSVAQKTNTWTSLQCAVSFETELVTMLELKEKYADPQLHFLNVFVFTHSEYDQFGQVYPADSDGYKGYTIVYQNVGWNVFVINTHVSSGTPEYVESMKSFYSPDNFSKLVEAYKMMDSYPEAQKQMEYKIPYNMNLLHDCTIRVDQQQNYSYIVRVHGKTQEEHVLSCKHCSILVISSPETKMVEFE